MAMAVAVTITAVVSSSAITAPVTAVVSSVVTVTPSSTATPSAAAGVSPPVPARCLPPTPRHGGIPPPLPQSRKSTDYIERCVGLMSMPRVIRQYVGNRWM